jgi:uncharacterized protein (DUF488 family)
MKHNALIYTIGYSCHTLNSFVHILQRYGISAVADVRSQPYSRFKPEFNQDKLSKSLKEIGLIYVFLGDLCGARIEAPECYINGKVSYSLIARHPKYLKGIDRILKGTQKYTIALMCAEKDPISCHRTILICRTLLTRGLSIKHILCDGTIEDHHDSELRLMRILNLDQPNMFVTEEQRLEKAYNLQADKIAYEEQTDQTKIDSIAGD